MGNDDVASVNARREYMGNVTVSLNQISLSRGCTVFIGNARVVLHGGAKQPPKWVMKCPVFWLIFNNFVTFHHFFTKLGNLIWVFVPNNLT